MAQRLPSVLPYNDGNGANSGHTRIYDWNGTDWVQRGNDFDGEAEHDLSFVHFALHRRQHCRHRCPLQRRRCWRRLDNVEKKGHTRIYHWNGTDWNQLGSDIDGEACRRIAAGQTSHSPATAPPWPSVPTRMTPIAAASATTHTDLSVGWQRLTQIGSDIDGEAAGDNSGDQRLAVQ